MDLAIRHIKDLLSDGYLLLSDDFSIIEFNQQALTLFPWLDSDTVGKDYFTLLRGKCVEAPIDQDAIESIRLDEPLKLTQRLKYSEKVEQSINWTITKIEADKQGYYCLIGQGIVPEKENESYFQGARSTLRQIIDSVPAIMYWKDRDGVILGCNNQFLQISGYKSVEDVIGLTDKDMPWCDYYAKYHQDDVEVIDTAKPKYDIDDVGITKNGVIMHVITNKAPLLNRNGNSYAVLVIATDITKRKQEEEALRLAKEEVEALSKSKNEFIANMSHDLRTPMHGISGMQDLVLMAIDKAEAVLGDEETSSQKLRDTINEFTHNAKRYANTAQRSTRQLIELFNQILESMSLDEGGFEETPKVFNLSDLIERNVMLLQSAAMHKKLDLSYHIAEQIPDYLYGLPIYLDRCIANLLSNSLKFTHQGYVRVNVGLPERSDNFLDKSFTLRIMISDTGIGIAEDKHKVVFKPFTRLTNSFDGVYKGSGLGLATVKQYVEKMHGTIELESEVGRGSTFTIQIPATVAENVAVENLSKVDSNISLNPNLAAPEQIETQKTLSPVNHNARTRLLVVDDNEPAAVFAQVCLTSYTCLVDIAGSGSEALELVGKHDYHLIFMDIGLPDIEGGEVIRQIRQLSDHKKSTVPIVALTGHAFSKEKRQKFFNMGVSAVLSKPASESELKSMVDHCVRNGGDPRIE